MPWEWGLRPHGEGGAASGVGCGWGIGLPGPADAPAPACGSGTELSSCWAPSLLRPDPSPSPGQYGAPRAPIPAGGVSAGLALRPRGRWEVLSGVRPSATRGPGGTKHWVGTLQLGLGPPNKARPSGPPPGPRCRLLRGTRDRCSSRAGPGPSLASSTPRALPTQPPASGPRPSWHPLWVPGAPLSFPPHLCALAPSAPAPGWSASSWALAPSPDLRPEFPGRNCLGSF